MIIWNLIFIIVVLFLEKEKPPVKNVEYDSSGNEDESEEKEYSDEESAVGSEDGHFSIDIEEENRYQN